MLALRATSPTLLWWAGDQASPRSRPLEADRLRISGPETLQSGRRCLPVMLGTSPRPVGVIVTTAQIQNTSGGAVQPRRCGPSPLRFELESERRPSRSLGEGASEASNRAGAVSDRGKGLCFDCRRRFGPLAPWTPLLGHGQRTSPSRMPATLDGDVTRTCFCATQIPFHAQATRCLEVGHGLHFEIDLPVRGNNEINHSQTGFDVRGGGCLGCWQEGHS